jgi:uncharacterized membrane protein
MYMMVVHQYRAAAFEEGGMHSALGGYFGVDVRLLVVSVVSFVLLVVYRRMEDFLVYNIRTAVQVRRTHTGKVSGRIET